ncbi:sigma factor SigB/phosphatase RsbP regulator RsbQ [Spirosoma luteolum]
MWRYIAPAFEADYKVVRFDYIGHGKQAPDTYNAERYSTLHGYAQDILDICHALELTDVILVGHSVSSMIGLLACLAEPTLFHRLIMIGPSPCYINDGEYWGGFDREDINELLATLDGNFLGWANTFGPVIMGNPDQPELGQELTASFCQTNPQIALQLARVTFYGDNRADLPRLRVPSLIIQAQQDVIAPLQVGEYVARHTPKSTLAVIEATGHCPHLSAPRPTIEAIREYLLTVN